jgi:hypothetical protein
LQQTRGKETWSLNRIHSIKACALPLLALALLIGAGCDTARVAGPDANAASWERLTLLTREGPDTLEILADGTLEFRASADSLSGSGLVSAVEIGRIALALEGAQLEPLAAGGQGRAGGVVVLRDGVRAGFEWDELDALPAGRQTLALELLELRSNALGHASERVEIIPTAPFVSGRHARVAMRAARVIRDPDGLAALIADELRDDVLLIPAVDFGREILLAVFAGPAVRSGSQVEIGAQVSRTAGGYLQVPVTLHEPGEACAGTVPESPFQIVRLRRIDAEIFFQWDALETACPDGAQSTR